MASSRIVAAARHFNTSASRQALVQAPIQLFGVEGRYAHALYSAASKEKKLDAVEKELKSFQDLIKKDIRLKDYLGNPSVKRREKKSLLDAVLKQQKASNLTVNLLEALAENGRISKMDGIFGAFAKLMSAHRGEVMCTVTSAKALDAAQLKELKAALGGFIKPGENILLETLVDPSIIGGMVVNIGDKYVDMSMASKIKTYTNVIKQAV